jgi:hypothetical protein
VRTSMSLGSQSPVIMYESLKMYGRIAMVNICIASLTVRSNVSCQMNRHNSGA